MMIAMTVPPITRTMKTTATATIIKVDPDPVASLGWVMEGDERRQIVPPK